ncbi:MAG: hypothetical protein K6C95_10185 [Lachnospiraceae bacterium]|nr:hypothetical protein [Lachnospiraceae bacterium]
MFMTWYMYNPRSRLAHNLKYGKRYLVQADYNKAVAEFKRVLSVDSGNEEAYRGLMEAALETEDTDTALSLYGRAESALSSYKEPLLSLLMVRAVDRLGQSDYDGALSVAKTVSVATGDENEASRIRALVVEKMISDASGKEPEEALALYRRLLEMDNIDAAAIYKMMADVYTGEGDHSGAVSIMEEGISATGSEELALLKDEYIREHAEVFFPDSFVKELNDDMAAADFVAASRIVRNDLFMYRMSPYEGFVDELGESVYDLSPIQPADMNTTVYAEHTGDGNILMLIVDWARNTDREAVFNEMVYVPEGGYILAMSENQKVTEANTLADELHYWEIGEDGLTEITEEDYFNRLSGLFENQFSAQLQDEAFAESYHSIVDDPDSAEYYDVSADYYDDSGGFDDTLQEEISGA